MRRSLRVAMLLGAALLASTAQAKTPPAELHKRLLTLDTHLDTALHFARAGWDFAAVHPRDSDFSQLDIPRMRAGALDGGFFAIYTDQGPLTAQGYADALAFARARSDLIDRTIAAHADAIAPALTAADARRLNARGKLIAFKSIENSYPIGEKLALLAEFKARGVRLASPVHGKNNQFADSATDAPRWGGLSPLGRQWVAEMNRLGLVIDASHASDATFDQMLALSKTPILLSHSSLRSANDHPRNLDEGRLRQLAARGGAMCVSTIFLGDMKMSPARAAIFAKYEDGSKLDAAAQRELGRQWRALDATEPMWDVGFDKYAAMVLRAIEVAGVDHICFGADWDGGGGLPDFDDIAAQVRLTARLQDAGYSDADIGKMWGGNVLRILAAAQER
ncbi:dipeptidase [Sandarakinorhabdus sp. DWP1-3-1]|uniref:dipeptidase n=1 Tax=Sandarakinorhabdus sp. DWP1-3-1 TaxID=2804627 RepID=UPI003CF97211